MGCHTGLWSWWSASQPAYYNCYGNSGTKEGLNSGRSHGRCTAIALPHSSNYQCDNIERYNSSRKPILAEPVT